MTSRPVAEAERHLIFSVAVFAGITVGRNQRVQQRSECTCSECSKRFAIITKIIEGGCAISFFCHQSLKAMHFKFNLSIKF